MIACKEEKEMVCVIVCSADHPFQKTDEIDFSKQFSGTRLSSCYMGKGKVKLSRSFPFLVEAVCGFGIPMQAQSQKCKLRHWCLASLKRKFTRKNKYINHMEKIKLWLEWEVSYTHQIFKSKVQTGGSSEFSGFSFLH